MPPHEKAHACMGFPNLSTHRCLLSASDQSATPPSPHPTASSRDVGLQDREVQGCIVGLVIGASLPGTRGRPSCWQRVWRGVSTRDLSVAPTADALRGRGLCGR